MSRHSVHMCIYVHVCMYTRTLHSVHTMMYVGWILATSICLGGKLAILFVVITFSETHSIICNVKSVMLIGH